ncbi:hypothetical protein K402DRAFT_78168 [Aulographum hederae CBS 113979]|uniref:Uncharacterized protein n=1 Tax=Aulographum hederae CBS 113979 TaxID=1176131 RepID=A0A6G1HG49_9PEZI|nr:hypothetical protein K402DRAFT_78168 [Aulographum hederae CBS 113979]
MHGFSAFMSCMPTSACSNRTCAPVVQLQQRHFSSTPQPVGQAYIQARIRPVCFHLSEYNFAVHSRVRIYLMQCSRDPQQQRGEVRSSAFLRTECQNQLMLWYWKPEPLTLLLHMRYSQDF